MYLYTIIFQTRWAEVNCTETKTMRSSFRIKVNIGRGFYYMFMSNIMPVIGCFASIFIEFFFFEQKRSKNIEEKHFSEALHFCYDGPINREMSKQNMVKKDKAGEIKCSEQNYYKNKPTTTTTTATSTS